MNSSIKLYEYSLPLKRALKLKDKIIEQRKGLILSNSKLKIFAEASPLDGYSVETYSQALDHLQSFFSKPVIFKSWEEFSSFLRKIDYCSSVKFALYSFFHQLFFKKLPIHKIATRMYLDVPYTSDESHVNFLDEFKLLLEKSSTNSIIKIKMSSYPVSSATLLMKEVLHFMKIINKKPLLHLDFNQVMNLEEGLYFFSHFKIGTFHQLEDPLKNPEELFSLSDKYPHPIALDHSLRSHSVSFFKELKTLCSFEFKPTLDMNLLLDPSTILDLKRRNLSLSLSSSYESSIGLYQIATFGDILGIDNLGIDTMGIFKEDSVLNPLYNEGSHITVPSHFILNEKATHLFRMKL